jgi:hypothetical protein
MPVGPSDARERNLALTIGPNSEDSFSTGQAREKSQKLGMQRRRQMGALVEKSSSAIGQRYSKGDYGNRSVR